MKKKQKNYYIKTSINQNNVNRIFENVQPHIEKYVVQIALNF